MFASEKDSTKTILVLTVLGVAAVEAGLVFGGQRSHFEFKKATPTDCRSRAFSCIKSNLTFATLLTML